MGPLRIDKGAVICGCVNFSLLFFSFFLQCAEDGKGVGVLAFERRVQIRVDN